MIKSRKKKSKSSSLSRIFVHISLILFTLLITLAVFIFSVASPVPDRTEEIMEEVLASGIPDLILGDTGIVKSNAMEIWYESIKPTEEPKGTILLIMGLGGTALEWPNFFVEPLVDAGFHVIRFDNRGTGLSTWTDRDFNISDMATDAVAVLDGLGIDAAHVVGMSMGGMIAQQMAIDNPDRVLTLTSYSSTANVGDSELPDISSKAMVAMTATALRYQLISSEKKFYQDSFRNQRNFGQLYPRREKEGSDRANYF